MMVVKSSEALDVQHLHKIYFPDELQFLKCANNYITNDVESLAKRAGEQEKKLNIVD